MQRVDKMRTSLLKYRSSGRTAMSRDSARAWKGVGQSGGRSVFMYVQQRYICYGGWRTKISQLTVPATCPCCHTSWIQMSNCKHVGNPPGCIISVDPPVTWTHITQGRMGSHRWMPRCVGKRADATLKRLLLLLPYLLPTLEDDASIKLPGRRVGFEEETALCSAACPSTCPTLLPT